MLFALLAGLIPSSARADGLIIPFAGANFSGDSGSEFGDAVDASRFNWGASFAWMGAGVIGIEGDFSYSPDFFGKTDVGGSDVFSAMGNLMLGIPFGGQRGFGIRPYGVAGVGVIHADSDALGTILNVSDYKIGWDFGGGVMMFFATHVGIRADVRYFRTFQAVDLLNIDIGDGSRKLDFARGSMGLILRF